jgi:hypothetical protein
MPTWHRQGYHKEEETLVRVFDFRRPLGSSSGMDSYKAFKTTHIIVYIQIHLFLFIHILFGMVFYLN